MRGVHIELPPSLGKETPQFMEDVLGHIRPAFPLPRIRPPYRAVGTPLVAGFSTYIVAKGQDHSTIETHRLHGSLLRDSVGRTKTHLWGYGPALEKIQAVMILTDPIQRTIRTVASGEWRIVEDSLDSAFDFVWSPADPLRVVEVPGVKTILGIDCRKVLFESLSQPTPPAGTNECWISDELWLVMEDIQESEASRSVWEIVRLDRREPDITEWNSPLP